MAMIETVNLTRKYGDLVALDNLNLSIEAGECFGFIGPNGAGKTTTIKILATLLKPTWGEARIDGFTVGWQNHLIRPIIGYVPDFMGAYDDMLVGEYLEFFAACYGIHGGPRRAVVEQVLELVELSPKRESEVNALSRGMQQRLSIARVLLHDPKVLLLDEPASGLDPRARIEIRELLKELRRMGKTILISSHILHELAELCTSVGIVDQGRLVFSGPVKEIIARASRGPVVLLEVEERSADAVALLRQVRGIVQVERLETDGVERIEVVLDAAAPPPLSDLPSRLVAAGFRLRSMQLDAPNLETAFMRLTRGLAS